MLISIGIDPGASNGAIAIIDLNLNILELVKAPYYIVEVKSKQLRRKLNKETGIYEKDYWKNKWTDFKALKELYAPYIDNDIIYTIEKVASRGGEGETNAFIFGDSMGVHRGQYSYLSPIEYYELLPQVWKNELGVTSDKNTSIDLANIIFEESLKERNMVLKKHKGKNKDDDLAEALLIALAGLKKYTQK